MTSTSSWYDSSLSRDVSVSSMRNTNLPPLWRANAQLNSAVRAMPTCGLPVGRRAEPSDDGASDECQSLRETTEFVRVPMPSTVTLT